MKLSVFSLAVAAGLAAAQSGSIPKCANSCVTKFTSGDEIGGCASLDVHCICSNADFLDGIACCLDTNCDADGKAAAVKYAQQICSAADVTVPDAVVCKSASTSASAATSAAASASASASAPASASASASASGSATGPADSSETETTTSATGSATDGNETGTATNAVVTASSTDSAGTGLNSAGGLLGAIVAILAVL